MNTLSIISDPRPATSYAEALERVRALQSLDSDEIGPRGRTVLLAHPGKTERAVVFFHGLTSSPQQFRQLGELMHASGANVLIPRAPHHGMRDRMTTALSRLTAEELASFADEAVNIAHGLGDRATVAGLSMGGVLAAWVGQRRSDVELSVIMSPAFGVLRLPPLFNSALATLIFLMPGFHVWWDPRNRDRAVRPSYGYPRYATRAVGQVLRLGRAVLRRARAHPPAARRVWVVVNPCDRTISNALVHSLLATWRAAGADNVRIHKFPADLRLIHDFISPDHVGQRVELVYPVLMRLMNERLA